MNTGHARLGRIVSQVAVATGTMSVLLALAGGLGHPYAIRPLVWSGVTALVWSDLAASDRASSTVGRAAVVGGLVSGMIGLFVWEYPLRHVLVWERPWRGLLTVHPHPWEPLVFMGIGLAVSLPGLWVARWIGVVSTAVPAAVGAALAVTMAHDFQAHVGPLRPGVFLRGDITTAVVGASVAAFVASLAIGLDRRRGVGWSVLLGLTGALLSVVLQIQLYLPRAAIFDGFALGLALLIIVPAVLAGGTSGLMGSVLGIAVAAWEARRGRRD
jgi:hypothetical protein